MRSVLLWLACSLVLGCGHSALEAPASPALETGAPLAAAPKLPPPRLDGTLASRFVSANHDAFDVARITIDTRSKTPIQRPAIDVVLCMDTSGSMEGKPIEDARAAALAFVDALRPGDGFALVTFDSTVTHVVPARRISKTDVASIRAAIGKIEAKGTTDMAGGMQAALEESQRIFDGTRANRVVLLGDGVPNDPTQIKTLAQTAGARGTGIFTVGLGPDYDEISMGEIAQLSGGRFRYAEDSAKIAGFFDEELVRVSQVSAKGAVLELTAGPGVVITQVIGQELSRVGNVVRVYLGDISLGAQRDLYVKVKAGPHRDGASVELFDAVLRYTADGAQREERVFLGAHATSDAGKLTSDKNDDVEKGAAVAQQAADKIDAIKKAHESDKTKNATVVVPSTNVVGNGGGPKPPSAPMTMPAPAALKPEDNLANKRAHADAMQTLFD